MKKLILLITLTILSFKASSQNVTTPSPTVTDTTVVVLPTSIARQVIKELLAYDNAKQEIIYLESIIKQKDSTIVKYVSIVSSKDQQIINLQSTAQLHNEQLALQTRLSEELESALKKEKIKNRILKISSVGTAAAGFVLGYFLVR